MSLWRGWSWSSKSWRGNELPRRAVSTGEAKAEKGSWMLRRGEDGEGMETGVSSSRSLDLARYLCSSSAMGMLLR